MPTANISQMQQYQQMLHHGMQQQPQQIGPAGGKLAEQIYITQAEDPNQVQEQRTPIRGTRFGEGISRGDMPLAAYQNPNTEVASSRHYQPQQEELNQVYENRNAYQGGLGSLFNNPGGPRQPTGAFENQFSELQNQMGGFGEQFTGLETSIGGLGESITSITDRLDSIEQGIKGLKTNDTSQAYTRMNWQPFSEWGRRRN